MTYLKNMKSCTNCNQEKELSEFNKRSDSKDGYRNKCKLCLKNNRKVYYKLNKNKIQKTLKKYYIKNSQKIREKIKLWNNKNKERVAKRVSQYTKNHKNAIYEYQKKYRKESLSKNYKLAELLRKRLRNALNSKNITKTNKALYLLGCNIDHWKNHLQQTAIQNGYKDFNINNYSTKEYHIDHIVPCSAFNLKCSYHQKLCFNYKNMQILTREKNLKKKDLLLNYPKDVPDLIEPGGYRDLTEFTLFKDYKSE